MPKLIEFYNDWHKKGVQIFAVCNETEMDKWKAYIKENNLQWINVADPNLRDNFRYDFDVATTPQVFVLDKDKIIRAKKLDVSQLDDFLKHESGKLN
jgi:ERCC4-related helicase